MRDQAVARGAVVIAELQPYPVMKDSGVEWLAEVPEHWEVRKLKYAVSFSGGGTPSKANESFWRGPIPWVSPKDMARARITDTTDHISEEAVTVSATSILAPGALLMVVRSGILRRTIPVAINAVEVALNQDMKALRPTPGIVQSEYLRALVQGNEATLIREWTKQGATVESIEHELLANSRVPLPPLPEQAAIVRYLDHVDRRVRRLVRAKRKLIALLTEQKQAIIHRAVTRGLDPDVPLKDSGVEWLGEVPEHWEVKPVGAFCPYISYGFTNPMPSVDEGPYMLTANDIGEGVIRYQTARHTSQAAFDQLLTRKSRPVAGDVLVTKDGTLGRVAVAGGAPACINQSVALLRVDSREMLPDYLSVALRGPLYQERMILDAGGTTIKHIYITRLSKMRLAYPPIDEQKCILDSLSMNVGAVEGSVEAARREISLLNEYRTRLIADVVTGKLDVREAAAELPEVDPLDARDDPDEALESDTEADVENALPEEADA